MSNGEMKVDGVTENWEDEFSIQHDVIRGDGERPLSTLDPVFS